MTSFEFSLYICCLHLLRLISLYYLLHIIPFTTYSTFVHDQYTHIHFIHTNTTLEHLTIIEHLKTTQKKMSNQPQNINPPESSTADYHIPGALPTERKNDTNQSETDSPDQRDLPSPTPDDSQSQASGSRFSLGGLSKGLGQVKQAVTGSNAGSNKNKDYEAGLKDLDNLKLSDEDVNARRESLAPGGSVAVDDQRDTLDKPASPPPSASQATPATSNADPIAGEGEEQQNDDAPAEEQQVDLSVLNGLTPNKTGVVIGPDGFPVGRVVEGNPRELAGRAIDGEDGCIYDGKRVLGRVEAIPEDQRETRHEGPFAGLEGLVVGDNGLVHDVRGSVVGRIVEGDATALRGRAVDEDGDIVDRYGTSKGRAEPYHEEEPQPEEQNLSILEGKTVNKAGNVVDEHGTVVGRIVSGDGRRLAGRRVDGQGQVWGDSGNVVGRAELIPGAEQEKPEGPFYGFEGATVGADGVVADSTGQVIGRVVEGDAARLLGRPVDEDGDILDKNGNGIGRAERWQPESKPRNVSPMAGRKVTREGEVRDADGNLIGKLTAGNLATLVGREIDDNGYVVDNDGNRLGECTLLENIPEPEPEGPTDAEKEEQRKAEEDRQLAQKMSAIVSQAMDRMRPICKMISEV